MQSRKPGVCIKPYLEIKLSGRSSENYLIQASALYPAFFASSLELNQTALLFFTFFAQSHFGEWNFIPVLEAIYFPGVKVFVTASSLAASTFSLSMLNNEM